MSHVPTINTHAHVGDPVTIVITLNVAGTVGVAIWKAAGLTKTLGTGITQTGETIDGRAVLAVTLTAADIVALGVGLHDWQLQIGGSHPFVGAVGELQLDARM